MKIKAVCERTGLTDRTIRYYIEEGLLSPSYTENYLGRKAFDFSEANISELNDIAMLRNFDFSIEEIRAILSNPQASPEIINKVKERISLDITTNQKKITVLSSLNEQTTYTVSELAKELSKPETLNFSGESVTPNISKRIISVLKGTAFFLTVWLPILISLTVVSVKAIFYENPIIASKYIYLTLLMFIPSIVYMLLSKTKLFRHRLTKSTLFALCVICIPLCAVFSFGIINECEHNWSVLTVEKQESCSSEGKAVKKCDICRDIAFVTLKKLPHTEVIDAAVEASCASDGRTEGKHCSVCNTVTVTQNIIPKTAHTYDKSVVSATCSEGGYTIYECSCGYSYIDNTVSATENHRFVKNEKLGYRCSECDLEVCEYGYANGGTYSPVSYYITGIIDSANEIERTLVIHGNGAMPDYGEHLFFHPWRGSPYIEEVKHIIICSGVTSIANGAFEAINEEDYYFGNPFNYVESFIVHNPKIQFSPESVSGIECGITYMP